MPSNIAHPLIRGAVRLGTALALVALALAALSRSGAALPGACGRRRWAARRSDALLDRGRRALAALPNPARAGGGEYPGCRRLRRRRGCLPRRAAAGPAARLARAGPHTPGDAARLQRSTGRAGRAGWSHAARSARIASRDRVDGAAAAGCTAGRAPGWRSAARAREPARTAARAALPR